jgi:hypothetical protein
MEVWTLAWDTDEGTGCSVHLTEREANLALIEKLTDEHTDDRDRCMGMLDAEDENLWDWMNDNLFDMLDTYSIESHTIEIPAPLLTDPSDQEKASQDDKPGLPPDPEGQNDDRAKWAGVALDAFQAETGTDDCDKLGDLLGDLMHWCDRNNQEFEWALDRARNYYRQETMPEPTL